MPKQLSDFEKGQTIAYHDEGCSTKCISTKMGRDKHTIRRLICLHKNGDSLDRKEGSGRKRKTSAQMDRAILREVKKNRFISARTIQNEFNLNYGPERICLNTIRSRIKEDGNFSSFWAARKPFISDVNIAKRLEWCREHQDWTLDQWRKVLWSDESPFAVRFDGKVRVWRMANERYDPKCITGTVKHCKTVMVWGCFAAHGVGDLHRIEGIMNAKDYKQILIHHMRPSLNRLFPDGDGIFQQDNDPKHTAHIIRNYIRRSNMNCFDPTSVMQVVWPAQSPDLNPIENLWSILDSRLKDRTPSNERELFQILRDEWNTLPIDQLTKLVDSMPNRCAKVIENRGYPIKY
jgi:transposase